MEQKKRGKDEEREKEREVRKTNLLSHEETES